MTIEHEAEQATRAAAEARDDARNDAIAGIRLIEAALQRCVPLRGLPNLTRGPGYTKTRGFSVRTLDPGANLVGRRLVLMVDALGRLLAGGWEPSLNGIKVAFATDDQLMVEDLIALTTASAWALERHIDACRATKADYTEARAFAAKLKAVLS